MWFMQFIQQMVPVFIRLGNSLKEERDYIKEDSQFLTIHLNEQRKRLYEWWMQELLY